MEQQPLGKLAPAQPHGASSLRPAHLGPAPGDAAPVKRKRGRPPGAKNKKTLLLEALGLRKGWLEGTPQTNRPPATLSTPLSAPLPAPSWDSLEATPPMVSAAAAPPPRATDPKPAPVSARPADLAPNHHRRGPQMMHDREAATALRQVSHGFVDLRDVVRRAREESAAVDEWRYRAARAVDAAREAAEDEAERRLRRNAALMAEVMSAEDESESKSTSAGEEENSREERLRAALAAATAGETRPGEAARAEDGNDDAFAALLARVDDAATAEDARTAVAAFRERFGSTAAAGRRGEARVTAAATLRRVQGGADVPRGWTATSVSL